MVKQLQLEKKKITNKQLSEPKYVTDSQCTESSIVTRLQQVMGNQAVKAMLCNGMLHAKLSVSHPNDPLEIAADRTADLIMGMQEADINRKDILNTPTADQVYADRVHDADLEQGIQSLQAGGKPLTDSEKAFFEPRFGADLSSVRIHDDAASAFMSESISAQAFAVGTTIAFGKGKHETGSQEGKRLMAHELAHVMQHNGKSLHTLEKKYHSYCKTPLQRQSFTVDSPAQERQKKQNPAKNSSRQSGASAQSTLKDKRGAFFKMLVTFWDKENKDPIKHLSFYLKMRQYYNPNDQRWSAKFLELIPGCSRNDMQTESVDTAEFFKYAETVLVKEITQGGDSKQKYADWLEFTSNNNNVEIMIPQLQSRIDAHFEKAISIKIDISLLREMENVIMHLIDQFSNEAIHGCKPEIAMEPPPKWYFDPNVINNIVAALGSITSLFHPKVSASLKITADIFKTITAIRRNVEDEKEYDREKLSKIIEQEQIQYIHKLASHLRGQRNTLSSMVLLRMQTFRSDLVKCLSSKLCRDMTPVDDFAWTQIIPQYPRNGISQFVQNEVNKAYSFKERHQQ